MIEEFTEVSEMYKVLMDEDEKEKKKVQYKDRKQKRRLTAGKRTANNQYNHL